MTSLYIFKLVLYFTNIIVIIISHYINESHYIMLMNFQNVLRNTHNIYMHKKSFLENVYRFLQLVLYAYSYFQNFYFVHILFHYCISSIYHH